MRGGKGQSKPCNWGSAVAWIALVIALYGAVLSTLQLYEARAEKARRFDVSLVFGGAIAKGVLYQRALAVMVRNPGYQEVAVAASGVILPDGKCVYLLDRQSPTHVPPGDNLQGLWAGENLVRLCDLLAGEGFNGRVTLVGFCQDGLGVLHKSAPLQFDVQSARRDGLGQATSPEVQGHQRHTQQ